jgi:hypothetical protein
MRGLRGSTEKAVGSRAGGGRAVSAAMRGAGSIERHSLAAAWHASHPPRFRGQPRERGTQRSLQRVPCPCGGCAVLIAGDKQLHARAARADPLDALRPDQGRGHGHPDRQRKPGQHEAGQEEALRRTCMTATIGDFQVN